MSITLWSEGAAGEVTGSRHVLQVDGRRLIVDCGAFQGRRAEADEKNRRGVPHAGDLDAMILTHAHYDHCGLTPVLVKQGFGGNILCTPATRDLAALVMEDSARIQQRDADYLARQAAKRNEPFDFTPLYDADDVARTINQMVTVGYERSFTAMDGVRAEFFDAGHILGSAAVHLTVRDDDGREVAIGFTGDLGRNDAPILRDPRPLPPVDYLVLESTYGNRRHDPVPDAVGRLADVVTRTVARGGKVVIPAFAIERTQEIIYLLHQLAREERIPDVPIYVDSPMAVSATGIFQAHPECYDRETYETFIRHEANPFGFEDLHYSRSVEQSKKINALKTPAIIISASGMCEAGRIQHHLIHTISDARNTVLAVGFMAAHTLGRRIVEGEPRVRIHGDWFDVKAEVEVINAFSAHADYVEIGEWLKRTDTSRLTGIYLVHGEEDAQEHMIDYLVGQGWPRPVPTRYGESYALG